MRIAVIGAGAIGCYLAARLQEGGHAVTLVGRSEQVSAINRHGLLLRDRRGERRYRLRAEEMLSASPELALLTVKTQDVVDACRSIQPYVEGVPVLAIQNGVRGDTLAAGVLGREAVAGGVLMCAVDYLRPGEVDVLFPGWVIIGESFRPAGQRARGIVEVLGCSVSAFLSHHLVRVRYSKLITNLNNALTAATGLLLADVVRDPAGRLLPVRLMKEGCAVLRAAGVRLDHGLYGLTPSALWRDPNTALIAGLQAGMATALAVLPEGMAMRLLLLAGNSRLNRLPVHGSTWQSIMRRRPTEIDFLNGEIVRMGRECGVATPYNERVVNVVREVERSGIFRPLADLWPATAQPVAAPAGDDTYWAAPADESRALRGKP